MDSAWILCVLLQRLLLGSFSIRGWLCAQLFAPHDTWGKEGLVGGVKKRKKGVYETTCRWGYSAASLGNPLQVVLPGEWTRRAPQVFFTPSINVSFSTR
ncbi:hypothetical protein M406DRAFT_356179 [Cryphonectria parasitica EP155]|uniref:Secreted protein n=1 Tax=Cryphonectria parasitica (strain ATCC 38755 / EP155) TaxID=660469 RepID=A0A9P4Y466_CRYP1|nr:uncharacterized protein M406DRAFT_356179 [Cryphonectria parasitica EP155]KAF3766047.1 hypothetical protein M406DRAFT_356179 [Cryphonectria parasitica EP155]